MLSACSTLSYMLTLRTEMLGAGGTLVAECLASMPKSLDAIPRTTDKWINRQKGKQRNKNHYQGLGGLVLVSALWFLTACLSPLL